MSDAGPRRGRLAGLCHCLLLLAACGVADQSAPPPLLDALPRPLTGGEQAAISAGNRFGFRLLQEVSSAGPASNVVISPLSVSLALGMVLTGAEGATRTELAAGLGFGAIPQSEIDASFASLRDLLLALDPGIDLGIANSLWSERTFPISPDYVGRVERFFDAEATPLDFGSPAAVATINDWVRRETHGRIPAILESIDPAEVLFAVNATYFKAGWRAAFRPEDTRPGPFTTSAGAIQSVPFMSRQLEVPYYADGELEAVDLGYGNGAFSMTVVLPRPNRDLDGVVTSLDPARWAEITGGFHDVSLHVELPKLTLEYRRTLTDDLAALGMSRAFDPDEAELGGISTAGGLHLTRVDHQTFVTIDEAGTEAGAATSVGVGVTSAGPSMIVNRPFLFAIRERLSGTIIFLGRIGSIPGA